MRRAVLVTAIAPALWGTTYAVTAELLPPGRPFLAATLRALPVGVAFCLVGRQRPVGWWWPRAAVLGICNFGAFFALLFTAAYRLPGGVAATIGATQPILVTVLVALILTEKPTPARLVAAVAGVAGVALLVMRSTQTLDPVGVTAALGGAASMAMGTVLVQRWGRPAPLLTFAGWQLVAGGLVLAPLTLGLEGLPSSISMRNGVGYAYLMILGAGVAYPLWFRGIERLGAGAVTFLSLLSPLVATIVGVAMRDERLSGWQIGGAATILASVALGNVRRLPIQTVPIRGRGMLGPAEQTHGLCQPRPCSREQTTGPARREPDLHARRREERHAQHH